MENGILKYLLFALAGYVSGSIMYSYLIPKLFCGVDIVKEGEDHNPGMTNVMRCVSVKLGVLCLLLDVAKGFVPVFLAKLYVPDYKSDWKYMLMPQKTMFYVSAYVWNKSDDLCSEFGTIGIRSFGGGIKRIM